MEQMALLFNLTNEDLNKKTIRPHCLSGRNVEATKLISKKIYPCGGNSLRGRIGDSVSRLEVFDYLVMKDDYIRVGDIATKFEITKRSVNRMVNDFANMKFFGFEVKIRPGKAGRNSEERSVKIETKIQKSKRK